MKYLKTLWPAFIALILIACATIALSSCTKNDDDIEKVVSNTIAQTQATCWECEFGATYMLWEVNSQGDTVASMWRVTVQDSVMYNPDIDSNYYYSSSTVAIPVVVDSLYHDDLYIRNCTKTP